MPERFVVRVTAEPARYMRFNRKGLAFAYAKRNLALEDIIVERQVNGLPTLQAAEQVWKPHDRWTFSVAGGTDHSPVREGEAFP